MTDRYNPQHGANMVDRYIGSSFDVVYAVYKIVDQLPMIYKFAVEYLPELERLVEEKVDKVEGKELSSNDFTDAYVDQLGLIRSAAYENIEAFEPTGSVAAALQAAKNYAVTVGQNSVQAANQYTDSSVIAGINTANEYTDTVDSDRKTYVDQAINAEKNRTDGQIDLAREYTDTKTSDLRSYTDTLHNSAKLYTDTHLATAKDYSDGVLVQANGYTDVRELALMAIINGQAQEIQANKSDIADLLQRVIALETAP